MPIYEYRCGSCGREFEELVRKDETPVCPACGKPARRLLSSCSVRTGGAAAGEAGTASSAPGCGSGGFS